MRSPSEIVFRPKLWRWSLAAYALTLAVATHWPKLRIGGPIARPDLYIHLGAFAVLGAVLTMAGLFGAIGSRRNLIFSWCTGVAYAAVDELTQAIPGLGRTAGLDDFGADAAGVTLGVAAAAVVARLARRWSSGAEAAPSSGGSANPPQTSADH